MNEIFMMKIQINIFALLFLWVSVLCGCTPTIPNAAKKEARMANVSPDNHDAMLPPNIAPMNFVVQEEGDAFITHIYSDADRQGIICDGKNVDIPMKEWKALLSASKGKILYTDIYVKHDGQWHQYQSIANPIATEDIDPYITYRLIPPSYEGYGTLALCQRDVTTFDERVLYDNRFYDRDENGQCINCHVPQDYNRHGRSQFHVRQELGGTVLIQGNQVTKVDLKTDSTLSAGVYPAWHPQKDLVAYSVNKTYQVFHTKDVQKIEVMDFASDLILYDVATNRVFDIDHQADEFESFPAWSPDGKTLYYVSAHVDINADSLVDRLVGGYDKLRYNIYRRSFDISTHTFGERELVFDASALGKSAAFPRVSPDGKSLLFALSDYGQFHIWHRSSDLYVKDLSSGDVYALDQANSSNTESYHSWSSNGKWILFASRRDDGSYTRLYVSYYDTKGKAHTPFLVPQRHGDTYLRQFVSYNVPEWMVNPVKPSLRDVAHAIGKPASSAQYAGSALRDSSTKHGKRIGGTAADAVQVVPY